MFRPTDSCVSLEIFEQQAEPILILPCLFFQLDLFYFLDNFLRPNAARPTNPEPKRSMVVGSGTAVAEVVFGENAVTPLPVVAAYIQSCGKKFE